MRAGIKRDWITALRSGDYEQGTGQLAFQQLDGAVKYCCLGVLCDLAVKAGVLPEPTIQAGAFGWPDGLSPVTGLDILNQGTLPLAVQEWAGVADNNPWIGHGDLFTDGEQVRIRAATANDSLGWDFDQIADAVEANVPEGDEHADAA
jgi:hypothetical protein